MFLIIAGEKKEFEEGINIEKLLELEKVETPEYVTVSLNDDFVDRGAFADTKLKDGDSVEFIYFMGGGAC